MNYRRHNMIRLFAIVVAAVALLSGCKEEQTYAEQKKAEYRAISSFLSNGTTVLDLSLIHI